MVWEDALVSSSFMDGAGCQKLTLNREYTFARRPGRPSLSSVPLIYCSAWNRHLWSKKANDSSSIESFNHCLIELKGIKIKARMSLSDVEAGGNDNEPPHIAVPLLHPLHRSVHSTFSSFFSTSKMDPPFFFFYSPQNQWMDYSKHGWAPFPNQCFISIPKNLLAEQAHNLEFSLKCPKFASLFQNIDQTRQIFSLVSHFAACPWKFRTPLVNGISSSFLDFFPRERGWCCRGWLFSVSFLPKSLFLFEFHRHHFIDVHKSKISALAKSS